jgi:predicted GNAT superfamily acetyltransferase
VRLIKGAVVSQMPPSFNIFMIMIVYTTSKTDKDLLQILELQKNNLPAGLTSEQIATQGFVTVSHSFGDLQKMNSIEESIIAKDDDRVIAYLLAMTEKSKLDIPILIPMFEAFDNITFRNKKISGYQYIVVGQVCVAAGYRGKGILDSCYAEYKKHFENKYDFAITEISNRNQRSLNAHKRIGFNTIYEYQAPDGETWSIVLWDWKV